MTREDYHEEYAALAVGHALRALEPDDEQLLLAHLPGCRECQRTLSEAEETAAELGYAVDPVDPPDSLRENLLAAARAEHPRAAVPLPAEPTEDSRDLLAERRLRVAWAKAKPGARTSAAPQRWRRGALVGVAAAVAAAAMLGVSQVRLLGGTETERASQYEAVLGELVEPGTRTVTLAGANDAAATAVMRGDHVWLVVEGLPPNDAERAMYVVWAAHNGDLTALRPFDVTDDKVLVVDVGTLPPHLAGASDFAVSHEKGRTMPRSPSGAVLTSARL